MSAKALITMEELMYTLDILNKIYDSVRIIRPLEKKVITLTEGALCETNNHCYDFWSTEKICSNCISMRAFNEKASFSKLSWTDDRIYMVIAVPVQDTAETVILELLKDVTGSMTVDLPKTMKSNLLLQTLNELGQLQIKDGLTGIYNRRFINERLPVDLINNSIDKTPYTIIFADIDRFKVVNDTYGHVAGDYVLKEYAGVLQSGVTAKDDWTARYGGEEFLIYLGNRSMALAVELAETIRKKVEKALFIYEGSTIRITSSFGVCSVSENWNVKMDELLEQADKNLYAAKSAGRNRVVASEL